MSIQSPMIDKVKAALMSIQRRSCWQRRFLMLFWKKRELL